MGAKRMDYAGLVTDLTSMSEQFPFSVPLADQTSRGLRTGASAERLNIQRAEWRNVDAICNKIITWVHTYDDACDRAMVYSRMISVSSSTVATNQSLPQVNFAQPH